MQIKIRTISNGHVITLEDGSEIYRCSLEDTLETAAINLLNAKEICLEEARSIIPPPHDPLKKDRDAPMAAKDAWQDADLNSDDMKDYCLVCKEPLYKRKNQKIVLVSREKAPQRTDNLNMAHRTCIKRKRSRRPKGIYWSENGIKWYMTK